MDARIPISEANGILGVNLSIRSSYTIGGIVITRLRYIPQKAESIIEPEYRFIVEQANERAILKLRVEKI